MKKLDWTAVTASNGLVFEEQTFEHINSGHKDSYIAFVKANIPSAWHTGKLVILYGCVDSGTPPARNLSAGAVYYNGEIYQVDSASFSTTGLQIGIWTLVDVDSGNTESTIKTASSSFVSHVLINSKFVFAAGNSGTGTFDEDSANVVIFDNRTGVSFVNGNTTNRTGFSVSPTYTTVHSFTTPDDGISRMYHFIYSAVLDADVASVQFRYKTQVFIDSVLYDSWETTLIYTHQGSYIHQGTVTIPPNTLFEIKDARESGTDGGVRRGKICVFSI